MEEFSMSNGLKAWVEVLKLGRVVSQAKEMNEFYKNTVLKALQEEGWFTYLGTPHTLEDMAANYNYTDRALLGEILKLLARDKVIKGVGGIYHAPRAVVPREFTPRLLSPGNVAISINYAKSIPRRLQGKYFSSTSGFNLFSFDEALSSNMYRVIRKVILAYSGVLADRGRLLDVGTGSGVELSHIFAEFLQRGALTNGAKMEFHGIDVNEDLLNIASEEFFRRVAKEIQSDDDVAEKYNAFSPTFKVGTATQIPYPDQYFDIVYISQVLHWTDPARALRELYRVTRDGGKVIGGQLLQPFADSYLNLTMLVIEGAHGFFSKPEMKQWVQEAGFKQASFATPVTAFILRK